MSITRKIVLLGPESTGKSKLAEELASHFNADWVPEYARQYIQNLQRPYTIEDISAIAKKQIVLEEESLKSAGTYLFCDTDLIVCKIWSLQAFGDCPSWIINTIKERKYELHLLLDIDLPWVSDPLREHPAPLMREILLETYKKELTDHHFPYYLISGEGDERSRNAILALNSHFNDAKQP